MLYQGYHQEGSLRKEVIKILSNYLIDEEVDDEDAENAIIYGIEC